MYITRCYICIFSFYQYQVFVCIITQIICVVVFVIYKSATARERTITDARYAVGYGNARKSATVIERRIADDGYTVGDGYTRKSATAIERSPADALYTTSYGYTRKSATAIESLISDAGYAVGYGYARKSATVIERRKADAFSSSDHNSFQFCGYILVIVRIRRCTKYISKMSYTFSVYFFSYKGYGYACKSATAIECRLTDARYTVVYGYVRKSATVIERTI